MNKKHYIAYAALIAAAALFYLGFVFSTQLRNGKNILLPDQLIAPYQK